MYYDPEVNPTLPSSQAQASVNTGARVVAIRNHATRQVNDKSLRRLPWYLTKGELDNACQGTIVLMWSQGSVPSVTGEVQLGQLWMDYRVEVQNPTSVAQPAVQAEMPQPILLEQRLVDLLQDVLSNQQSIGQTTTGIKQDTAIIASKPAPSASSIANSETYLRQIAQGQPNKANIDSFMGKMLANKGPLYVDERDGREKWLVKTDRVTTFALPNAEAPMPTATNRPSDDWGQLVTDPPRSRILSLIRRIGLFRGTNLALKEKVAIAENGHAASAYTSSPITDSM